MTAGSDGTTGQITGASMRVGIVLPIDQGEGADAPPTYPEIRAVARAAEDAGLDSLWVFDHLLFRFKGKTTGIHECWTILSAIAEATSRVQLGSIVMCTSFRNPALLAKMAATLDHVCDGRLILGIGCGWHDPEYQAFGYPTDHKVGRFEESLTVIRDLIREGRADLAGQWVTADDVVLLPPARRDIPILIAAKRPRMLELTARHADAWNLAWFGVPDEKLATSRADLAEACARVGRDPDSLEITVGVSVRYPDLLPAPTEPAEPPAPDAPPERVLQGSVVEIAAGLGAHAALGTGHLIAALDPTTPESVRRFAESVELWRAEGAARS
ncbi:MAG TPA: LLM class flavin-dependent oxidoreductase [Candidatus Saccharimonadales bacterium]|nr:LLM class flavin-dependent oxidoreductase [Candidatus Saccharimonadales bacterium]